MKFDTAPLDMIDILMLYFYCWEVVACLEVNETINRLLGRDNLVGVDYLLIGKQQKTRS